MEYNDQRFLELFLQERIRHREKHFRDQPFIHLDITTTSRNAYKAQSIQTKSNKHITLEILPTLGPTYNINAPIHTLPRPKEAENDAGKTQTEI